MNEESMVSARLRPDGTVVQVLPDGTEQPFERTTDWARFDAMTDEEIEANSASDPDNPPLTLEEVTRLRRVPYIKHIRQRLGLTQEQFAVRFQLPLGTIRDWERGAREPDTAAKNLLCVIAANPEAVVAALAQACS